MKHNRLTGEIDGTPQEITDFYTNLGFNASDVFEKRGKTFFLTLPAVLFVLCCVFLLIFDQPLIGEKKFTIGIIITLFVTLWFIAAAQHYLKQWLITLIIFIGCITIILLASKQISLSTISTISQDAAKSYLTKDNKDK
ncbi:hypothetical protein HMPREF3212_01285 [Citrobacter freundii]|uniref:hypothetical protein n=1 Tax=Citrobacter freundii TaxID=546 RepID=UPI000764912A|nr:hypothetical protein [Citrobacter freundii]KWZ91840.1 hypothetical protein HMPREF3212_01285 [Citrobacter freundii]